VRLRNMLLI